MQRNPAAIRDVLVHVEENQPFTGELRQLIACEVDSECSQEEVSYAIWLALDRGYLDGVWQPENPVSSFRASGRSRIPDTSSSD